MAVSIFAIHALGDFLSPPLIGPVRDWAGHLPRIEGMGFDWVYLNPIHYPGFSGSLYALALTGVTTLGAITPIGGLAFMAGWIALILENRKPA